MFLMRSLFWLTVAFFVIKPGVDLERSAKDLSAQAMASGQQFISTQIENTACETLQCVGGKAVLSAAVSSIAPAPTQNAVPLPRPRPDAG